jgi:hypothetical protein
MEIITRTPARGWHRAGMALGCLALLLAIGLLVPAAMGLQQRPLADAAFAGTDDRGALLYEESVIGPGEVRAGDVISFTAPAGPAAGHAVTRRVVAVEGSQARTRGDQREEMWRVQLWEDEVHRVVFAIPFAGHPQLLIPWLTWPLIAVLLGLIALGALVSRGRAGSHRNLPAPPVIHPARQPQPQRLRVEPAADPAASSV